VLKLLRAKGLNLVLCAIQMILLTLKKLVEGPIRGHDVLLSVNFGTESALSELSGFVGTFKWGRKLSLFRARKTMHRGGLHHICGIVSTDCRLDPPSRFADLGWPLLIVLVWQSDPIVVILLSMLVTIVLQILQK
jgi:hypothetical protein